MMTRLVLVFALLAGCGGWTKRDTLAELGFATITADDWRQTRTITRHCDEINPLIGPCGENLPVDGYFPAAILLHAAISAALPPRWRTLWQGVTIGAELNQVWRNHQIRWWEEPPSTPMPTSSVLATHPVCLRACQWHATVMPWRISR
jgi:hypothetical protein